MPCFCGDSQCPSCGSAQGTLARRYYTGSQPEGFWTDLLERLGRTVAALRITHRQLDDAMSPAEWLSLDEQTVAQQVARSEVQKADDDVCTLQSEIQVALEAFYEHAPEAPNEYQFCARCKDHAIFVWREGSWRSECCDAGALPVDIELDDFPGLARIVEQADYRAYRHLGKRV